MKKRDFELIVYIVFLCMGGLFLTDAFTAKIPAVYKNELILPYDFPKIIIFIAMALVIVLLIANLRGRILEKKQAAAAPAAADNTQIEEAAQPQESSVSEEKTKRVKVVVSMFLIIAFVLLWKPIGFYPATFVFMVAETMLLPEKKSILKSLIISVATTAVCYLVFGLLFKISFPACPLF